MRIGVEWDENQEIKRRPLCLLSFKKGNNFITQGGARMTA